jgi:hypothetical protein
MKYQKRTLEKTVERLIGENDTGYLLYTGKEQPYLDNCKIWNFKKYFK